MNESVINIISVEEAVNQWGKNQKTCKTDDNKTYYVGELTKENKPTKAFPQIQGEGTYKVSIGSNGKSIVIAEKVGGTPAAIQQNLPKVEAPSQAPKKVVNETQESIEKCNSFNGAVILVAALIKKSDFQWKFIKDTEGKVIGHEATELVRYLASEGHDMKKHGFVDSHTQGILDEFKGSKVVETK
jgi:hypothetical protein